MVDVTTLALEKALEMRMREHEIHTSNIANANVPNYKAKKIDFQERMRDAMRDLNDGLSPKIHREEATAPEIQSVEPQIYEDPLARMNGDGNTVDMEREQAEVAKNTIAYETALQLISKRFGWSRHVLSEGGSK